MDQDYFDSYSGLGVHRLMLQDESRMEAFRAGIRAVVKPGQTVLDVGSGTGILSFWAAEAGAGEVIGVDNTQTVEAARELARINEFDDVVRFVRGMAEQLELKEKVDVIVSEWMGYFALAETMFKSFVAVRDRLLAEGGTTIPSAISLHLAPIEDWAAYFDDGPGMWEVPIYGMDFHSLVDRELENLSTVTRPIPERSYLAPPAELVMIDCVKAPVEEFFFKSETEYVIERDGILHGFAGHFEAELAPEVILSTASTEPLTHWRQSYFPVRDRDVRAGDTLRVRMQACEASRGDRRLPVYTIEGELIRDEVAHPFSYRYDATFE